MPGNCGNRSWAEALCPALCLPRAICKEYANKLRVVKMCTPALQMKKLRLRGGGRSTSRGRVRIETVSVCRSSSHPPSL